MHLGEHDIALNKDDKNTVRQIMRRQVMDVLQVHHTRCAKCRKEIDEIHQYRCLFCGLWFCYSCAKEHFE